MGFTAATAITTDSDLLKFAFEQQIANLLRAGNTYTELHKGAVDTLIAEHLRPRGFNTAAELAAIANSDDFKPALVCWVLSQIFAGQGGRTPAERDISLGKASYYQDRYYRSLRSVVIAPSTTEHSAGVGLPYAINADSGSMYPPLGSTSDRPTSIAGGEVDGYGDFVIEST